MTGGLVCQLRRGGVLTCKNRRPAYCRWAITSSEASSSSPRAAGRMHAKQTLPRRVVCAQVLPSSGSEGLHMGTGRLAKKSDDAKLGRGTWA